MYPKIILLHSENKMGHMIAEGIGSSDFVLADTSVVNSVAVSAKIWITSPRKLVIFAIERYMYPYSM